MAIEQAAMEARMDQRISPLRPYFLFYSLHPVGQGSANHYSTFFATRNTSSSVVVPSRTLRMPSS